MSEKTNTEGHQEPEPTEADTSRQLTMQQLNAIDLLARNYSDGEAAEAVGVTRQTLNGWKNHHPLFMNELHRRRAEYASDLDHQIQDLGHEALARLAQLLRKTYLEDEARFRVATAVLKMCGLPRPRTGPGAAVQGSVEPPELVAGSPKQQRPVTLARVEQIDKRLRYVLAAHQEDLPVFKPLLKVFEHYPEELAALLGKAERFEREKPESQS